MSIPDQCAALLDKDRLAHEAEDAAQGEQAPQQPVVLTDEQMAGMDDTAGIEA